KRFYNNSFTDAEKQHSINLFLGNYVPWKHFSVQDYVDAQKEVTGDRKGFAALRRTLAAPRSTTGSLEQDALKMHLWDLETDYYLHHRSDDSDDSDFGKKGMLYSTKWWKEPLRRFSCQFSHSRGCTINDKLLAAAFEAIGESHLLEGMTSTRPV